jgi:threonine dehydratase
MASPPVVIEDLVRARERIAPYVARTPLTHSPLLSERASAEVFLKQENRQVTGSFKPRGAVHKLLTLSAEERARGIVAASAGNHALGVAHACQALGVARAELYVPRNASPAKLAKLRRYPVELRLEGDSFDAAQAAAFARARETGATYASPYDDPAVIAGQGTVGLEILEDLPEPDVVVVPVGGGALLAGIAVAVKARCPRARVVGVNPAASPSALLSFQRGEAIDPYGHEPTLAHGLAGGFGRVPFEVARSLVDEIVLVSEEDLRQAIVALIDSDQLLAEASGAASLAAVLSGRIGGSGGRVVVVVSGGNIDSATLARIIREAAGRSE